MLGRLFKYELKATAKILVPIYIAFIAITGISRVSLEFQIDEASPLYFLSGIGALIFMLSAIAMFVTTAIVIIWRFYRNTSSSEGYLLFTLPVKTDYIIISEFLCAFIWSIVMAVVTFIGILLMILNLTVDDITISLSYFGNLFSLFTPDGIKAFFILIANMIVSTISEIMAIYCAISLASLLKKHRLIFSVLFYIGLVIITNTLDALLIQFISQNNIEIYNVATDAFTYDTLSFFETWNYVITPSIISSQTIVDFIFVVFITAIEYFIIRNILRRHLNIN